MENLEKKTNILDDLILYKKLKDIVFGEILLYQNKINGKIIFKYKYITDKYKLALNIIDTAKDRVNLNGKYLLKFYDYSCEIIKDLCMTYFVIYYYIEYPENNNLYNLIALRKIKKEKFKHEELTFLIYQILNSLTIYEKSNLSHKNLSPILISINYQNNKKPVFKLIDNFKSNPKYDIKNKMISSKDVYCSPELLFNINNDNNSFKYIISDVFSLGLIVLQCGTMQSLKEIYDFKYKLINKNNLNKLIEIFYSNYYKDNKFLCLILSNLLNLNSDKRMTPYKIYSKIPNYEIIKTKLWKKTSQTLTTNSRNSNSKNSILSFKFGEDKNEFKNRLKNKLFKKKNENKKPKNIVMRPKTSYLCYNNNKITYNF